MPLTRLYRDGNLKAEGFPIADVSDHIEDPDAVVWFDLCRPTEEDLATISEELGLHELAVEDAAQEHQRPKVDRYDSHLFLSAYGVSLDENDELVISEVNAFVTKNALVTVRKDDGFDIGQVLARWDAAPPTAPRTVGFLLHGLLDFVVDGQFETVETLDDQIEDLEATLFEEKPYEDMDRRTFELRKSLVVLRRCIFPMRDVVTTVMRPDVGLVDAGLQPYYQDVHDHVLRAGEWVESLREMVATVRETHLTLQGNRLNIIMKQVTSWAAIIAVPTAVTGFYGQNVPYPGFNHLGGFWASTLLMVVLSVGLFFLFRKRNWL